MTDRSMDRLFDDEMLVELSKTEAGRDALRIAMALESDAQALSASVADVLAPVRVAHEDRSRRRVHAAGRGRVARWAAVAAAVAFGFALMLKQAPTQAPAAAQPEGGGDSLLVGDFEAGPATDGTSSKDALFVDDFGA